MTGDRYNLIGIKQIIRLEWLKKTVNLLLAGFEAKAIRNELHEFLQNDQLYNTLESKRSSQTRTFAVNNLMKIWVTPDPALIPFRNASLDYIRQNPNMDFAVHWGMLCAAYPFWHNIALYTGRLLSLHNQITSTQITNRIKEKYGDRTTVIRNTGYVISAFTAWGVLNSCKMVGYYESVPKKIIKDENLAILMLESVLLTIPEAKSSLNLLIHCPSLFPLQLPLISIDCISRYSERLEIINFNDGNELIAFRS